MTWYEWRNAPPGDFAVVGDPVSHSLSPKMHSAAYAELNLALTYNAVRVPTSELTQAFTHLTQLGYTGANITVPLKEEAYDWCEKTEGLAQKIKAVNTVRFSDKTGINTDAPGFLKTLETFNIRTGTTVLLLGAGGTARALIAALEDANYQIRAWNRTPAKLQAVLSDLQSSASLLDQPDPADCQAIINTTSASLNKASLPILWQNAPSDLIAYDLMYASEPTLFMQEAKQNHLKSIDGRHLLVEQGALAFEWWLKKSVPRKAMLQAVHERAESHP